MIVFLNEDRAYRSWLARHHDGFVLNSLRRPTRERPTLHRANCPCIKPSTRRRSTGTTGRRLKACSAEWEELAAWGHAETGREVQFCPECRPNEAVDALVTSAGNEPIQITRLGREILDYVLDVAVLHLDEDDGDYRLTAEDVARSMEKTLPQLSAAVMRLIHDGLLSADEPLQSEDALRPALALYPSVQALRTMPAFRRLPRHTIEGELRRLRELR